jgi:hypothetical protein
MTKSVASNKDIIFWTFQDEDMMGIMASLARNCRLLLQGPAERWLLHYFSVTIPAVSDH